MIRAFRSELVKFRRPSTLAGVLAMTIAAFALPYLAVSNLTGQGASDGRFQQVFRALPTAQGLITLLSFASLFIEAIVVAMVTASVAAEWSQGTLRNLLVRQPRRLLLLTGKMLALLVLVAVAATLALLVGTGFTLLDATSHGLPTAAWTSWHGIAILAGFWGNELLALAGVSLLGMLIAVLARSAGLAIGISLAYVLIAEDLITAVWPAGAKWFPLHLLGYLWGTASPFSPGRPPMGYAADMIGAVLFMTGFAAVSAISFRRQDITA